MKQEAIITYNKRCAEFLNLREEDECYLLLIRDTWYGLNDFKEWADTSSYVDDTVYKGYKEPCWKLSPLQLRFHCDWNWIMAVYEKIEQLKVVLPDVYKKGFLKGSTHGNILIDVKYDSRDEFRGWYSSVSIELEHPFIYDSLNNKGEERRLKTKKEATVEALNRFLIWYDKYLKTTNNVQP